MVPRFLRRATPNGDGQQRIDDMRFIGYAGTKIKMHRAFLTMPLRQIDIASALVLPLLFDALLLFLTDPLVRLWHDMLVFLNGALGLGAIVGTRTMDLGPVLVALPNLEISVPSTTVSGSVVVFLATIAILLASTLMKPERFLPIIYFLRALVLVMWTALLYFAFFSAVVPIQLTDYMAKSLAASYVLMFLVPWLHGIALYIFDFSIFNKIGLTLLTLVYLALFVPMQYLLQLVVFHYGSILFLPLGFMAFGTFLDVFIIVALYGWGMTWRTKRQADWR